MLVQRAVDDRYAQSGLARSASRRIRGPGWTAGQQRVLPVVDIEIPALLRTTRRPRKEKYVWRGEERPAGPVRAIAVTESVADQVDTAIGGA